MLVLKLKVNYSNTLDPVLWQNRKKNLTNEPLSDVERNIPNF